MLTLEQVECFVLEDSAHQAMLGQMRAIDPLDCRKEDWLEPYRQKYEPMALDAYIDRFHQWESTTDGTSTEAALAVRRDTDKVIGHMVATGRRSATPEFNDVLCRIAALTDSVPRANVYDYTFGNTCDVAGSYTGDERELAIIRIFESTLSDAHIALRSLAFVRSGVSEGLGAAAIRERLDVAADHVGHMRKAMTSVYREIGPEFVANELTRYIGGFTLSLGSFEGPNPSHGGFLVLDRLVAGSFEPMYVRQPGLRAFMEFRMQDMPQHLSRFVGRLDASGDNAPLPEICSRAGAPAISTASRIVSEIRKFKVMHKSYADKGLAAKGGTLNEAEPDVLSESIGLLRQSE